LEQGARVIGLDRNSAPERGDYEHHTCDLSDVEQISVTMKELSRRALDGIVNVAGIDPKFAIAEADPAAWSQVIDINLRAYHLIIHYGIDALRRGTLKSIVNLGSINHRLGVPRRGLYTVAKCGVLGLTRGLARELGAEGIRINTVSPGWVFTEGQVAEYFGDDSKGQHNLEELNAKQSLPIRLTPEDVAAHVLFYISGASRASSGHNCIVDAGWLLE
jgi:NAD(P)-dependent dehydrogenase (short-subunit alcohol dehydrogenase family)